MKSNLSVSVVMTSYNGAPYITDQLLSLARQTLLPSEVVICDDGSTDNTVTLIKDFAETSPFPLRLIVNPERLGYRANFMQSATSTTGDLIAFCDQDDVWHERKLEACRNTFADDDTLLTYHNATVTNETLKPIGTLSSRAAPTPVNPAQTIEPWAYGLGFSLVMRRMLLDFTSLWSKSVDFNHPEECEAHDQWFCFLASSLGTTRYLAEPLSLYRQHSANSCGWQNKTQVVKNKLKTMRATTSYELGIRKIVAKRREQIMEEIEKSAPHPYRERAKMAREGYQQLSDYYSKRQAMYQSRNPFKRLGTFVGILYQGGYRPKNLWGTGSRAMIRDLLCGFVAPTDEGLTKPKT